MSGPSRTTAIDAHTSCGSLLWFIKPGHRIHNHPVLLLSTPPFTSDQQLAVLLITSFRHRRLVEKYPLPHQQAEREQYLPLAREPPEVHPDTGKIVKVCTTGEPSVPRLRQGYVYLKEVFWVGIADLQMLWGGSANTELAGLLIVLDGVQRCVGEQEWTVLCTRLIKAQRDVHAAIKKRGQPQDWGGMQPRQKRRREECKDIDGGLVRVLFENAWEVQAEKERDEILEQEAARIWEQDEAAYDYWENEERDEILEQEAARKWEQDEVAYYCWENDNCIMGLECELLLETAYKMEENLQQEWDELERQLKTEAAQKHERERQEREQIRTKIKRKLEHRLERTIYTRKWLAAVTDSDEVIQKREQEAKKKEQCSKRATREWLLAIEHGIKKIQKQELNDMERKRGPTNKRRQKQEQKETEKIREDVEQKRVAFETERAKQFRKWLATMDDDEVSVEL